MREEAERKERKKATKKERKPDAFPLTLLFPVLRFFFCLFCFCLSAFETSCHKLGLHLCNTWIRESRGSKDVQTKASLFISKKADDFLRIS